MDKEPGGYSPQDCKDSDKPEVTEHAWTHTVFHSGFTILHFQQHCTRVPISPHLCQHKFFSFFVIVAILL